jgi:hypothetical protein
MSKKKVLTLLLAVGLVSATLTGCKDFDKPEVVEIEASQTAFLIPLTGDTSEQAQFQSEELLSKAKVPSKRVTIPHEWLQEGRGVIFEDGKWIPSEKLIVVERKPATREWTEKSDTGSDSKNQGICAESKESIGFMVRMNCSAQIDEEDAVKFLYRYNSKTLEDIMDTEIRAQIESVFVEQCAKLSLEEILISKENIMTTVRNKVMPYFKERGISITVIGLKGEFTYLNAEIQKSIDAKFQSSKALETQRNENQRILEKAKADAEAINIQASTIQSQIELKKVEVESKKADAMIEMGKNWKPSVIGGNSMIQIPSVDSK